uniref:ATP synthase subunit b n=1 Tax=uncultured bacterium pAW1 TaxID=1781155 RepID=A0A1C9U4S2_9BACT|nr:ATP synthase subunit b [uncultured bacterium pAW1]
MSIEWQQLLTHALGFILTLWILKKFAWAPLLGLMEERRNRIAEEFRTIDEQKSAVAQQQALYEARMREIDSERRAKLVEAVEEGKHVAAEMKAQAQHEVKELHAKARTDLERDVAKARVELRDQMVAMTMSATEKIIKERLDETKHRELISRYIEEVDRV